MGHSVYTVFATQLFSLSVVSGKNWLLDLGFMRQEMFISDKTVLNGGIRTISFRKKCVKPGTVLIETV